ncbi:MAG: hypothetical protein PHO53_01915 [Actinomycetota bacterium]|nr:hypothetical protein [Actinomycetota bacterium]
MTRINLLPPEKIKERKAVSERAYMILAIALPVIVLAIVVIMFISASSEVSKKEEALQTAKDELSEWQSKNQELAQYKQRQEAIAKQEKRVISVLEGRIYWARILNNIAIMCPSDIWLTSLSASSEEGGSGRVTFSGYALQTPGKTYATSGTYPHYPDYLPIAAWIERMSQIAEFESIWVSSATPEFEGTTTSTANPAFPTGVVTGPLWYEDPVRVGSVSGIEMQEGGQYIGFLGDWVIKFDSEAKLNKETAVIGGTSAGSTEPATPTSTTGGAK